MGPLKDITILEFAGIGPGPFCGMLLADLGAEVIKINRPESKGTSGELITDRSKKLITFNLKNKDSLKQLYKLIQQVDGVFEGYRPGVMEKLKLGPNKLLQINPSLVYGRMTGWGQYGTKSKTAGHDINYISLTGVLNSIGEKDEKPSIPLNLVGDYGGGAMMLAVGLLSALLHSKKTGEGQVVDAAMTDGSALLMSLFFAFDHSDFWSASRGSNLLDGGAHFYSTYECLDGKYIAVGCIEEKFYKILLEKLKIKDEKFNDQFNKDLWPYLKNKLEKIFISNTRDHWEGLFEGSDACVTPVLDFKESVQHSQNKSRSTFIDVDGVIQPNVSPRFSKTVSKIQHNSLTNGEHNESIAKKFNLNPKFFD